MLGIRVVPLNLRRQRESIPLGRRQLVCKSVPKHTTPVLATRDRCGQQGTMCWGKCDQVISSSFHWSGITVSCLRFTTSNLNADQFWRKTVLTPADGCVFTIRASNIKNHTRALLTGTVILRSDWLRKNLFFFFLMILCLIRGTAILKTASEDLIYTYTLTGCGNMQYYNHRKYSKSKNTSLFMEFLRLDGFQVQQTSSMP